MVKMTKKKTFKDMKNNNIAIIIQTLLKNASMSRIEISECCGLSPSTVGSSIGILLEQNIVEELCEGVSTGGRPPIVIRLNPDCCMAIAFEITRSGVTAKVFNAHNQPLYESSLSSRMLSGNALSNIIVSFIDHIKSGALEMPQNIIGIGLLCQDDIPDFDLNVEFSTSMDSAVISLERFLSGHVGVPVRKEYIERYSLEHYMQNIEAVNRNYAYINLGERATASFFVNKKPVDIAGETVFDISSIATAEEAVEWGDGEADTIDSNKAIDKLTVEELAKRLMMFITFARMFFPVEDIFLGGIREDLDEVAYKTTLYLKFNPIVRKLALKNLHLSDALARRLILENHRLLLT